MSYNLRQAKQSDIDFLFEVSYSAMKEVNSTLNPLGLDMNEEYEKYSKNFNPTRIQIIQYKGKDVGRLRVVRSKEKIYIGGIQILPEFQSMGIGSSIFKDLIKESNNNKIPIYLEVHHVNTKAYDFYKKLGFVTVKSLETKKEMVCKIKSHTSLSR